MQSTIMRKRFLSPKTKHASSGMSPSERSAGFQRFIESVHPNRAQLIIKHVLNPGRLPANVAGGSPMTASGLSRRSPRATTQRIM